MISDLQLRFDEKAEELLRELGEEPEEGGYELIQLAEKYLDLALDKNPPLWRFRVLKDIQEVVEIFPSVEELGLSESQLNCLSNNENGRGWLLGRFLDYREQLGLP